MAVLLVDHDSSYERVNKIKKAFRTLGIHVKVFTASTARHALNYLVDTSYIETNDPDTINAVEPITAVFIGTQIRKSARDSGTQSSAEVVKAFAEAGFGKPGKPLIAIDRASTDELASLGCNFQTGWKLAKITKVLEIIREHKKARFATPRTD